MFCQEPVRRCPVTPKTAEGTVTEPGFMEEENRGSFWHQLEKYLQKGSFSIGSNQIYRLWRDREVLTKREELSFFTVFAFPKDSRMGLAWSSCRSSSPYNHTDREINRFITEHLGCRGHVFCLSWQPPPLAVAVPPPPEGDSHPSPHSQICRVSSIQGWTWLDFWWCFSDWGLFTKTHTQTHTDRAGTR